jgi:hypothetical protein
MAQTVDEGWSVWREGLLLLEVTRSDAGHEYRVSIDDQRDGRARRGCVPQH